MKTFFTPILTTLAVAQLLMVAPTKAQETLDLYGLLSKGPRVMPDLARLLQSEASTDERIKAVDAMGAIAGGNPATGATIQIKAKRVVKFRVAKAAKDAILGVK